MNSFGREWGRECYLYSFKLVVVIEFIVAIKTKQQSQQQKEK